MSNTQLIKEEHAADIGNFMVGRLFPFALLYTNERKIRLSGLPSVSVSTKYCIISGLIDSNIYLKRPITG